MPSRSTDTTQDSAPIACHRLQCGARQAPPATEQRARHADRFPDPFCLPPDRPKRPVAREKVVLSLRLLVGHPREEEDEEEVDCEDCWDRGTTGVLPPQSAADEAEEALPYTGADFLGIRGGCKSVIGGSAHLGQSGLK